MRPGSRRLCLLLALALVLPPARLGTPVAAPLPPPLAAPLLAPASAAEPPGDVQAVAQRAYSTVQELSVTVGSRPTGSEAERRAAEWLKGQLEALGYATTLQPFPVTTFRDRGASLAVEAPAPALVRARNLYYGGAGEVTAEAVYGGLGRSAEVGASAAGKIVVVDRGVLTFQEKVENAVASGALAVVVINNEPGELRGALRSPASVPVVGVAQEDGAILREGAKVGGMTLHVRAETELVTATSHNVVGVRERPGAPIIIVGGHYDSVEAGPGANDNASGTAAALEVARALAEETRAEVRYVAFGAEEIGLVGSRTYVSGLSEEERGRVRLMVNLDMVGVGDRLLVGGSEELAGRLVQLAKDQGIEQVGSFREGGRQGSDHASFLAAGMPAVFLHWSDDPRYHTAEDKAEHVQPERLGQTARLALALIQQTLADQPAS